MALKVVGWGAVSAKSDLLEEARPKRAVGLPFSVSATAAMSLSRAACRINRHVFAAIEMTA